MWLMTRFGFFSVVEKELDRQEGMLTVRSRVHGDLEALRKYLPSMGEIMMSGISDYRYRVCVPKKDFAEAAFKIAMNISYTNFKDEVLRTQGIAKASVYTRVWEMLRSLQNPAGTKNI